MTLLGLSIAATGYGQQDLIRQVPSDATYVAIINNQAIVKHSSLKKINDVLLKVGAFDEISDDRGVEINSISDLDLSYDRNAYVYKTETDSAYYTGILLPLKKDHHVGENLFRKLQPLSTAQGYEQRISADGKTRVAWNDNSILILTGGPQSYFFDSDSVAQRYGLEQLAENDDAAAALPSDDDYYNFDYGYHDSTADSIAAIADSVADGAYRIADSIETEWNAFDFAADSSIAAYTVADTARWSDESPDENGSEEVALDDVPPPPVYPDYPAYDIYSDSTYLKQQALRARNDSIKDAAFASWLAKDFESFLHPAENATLHKYLTKFDKKNTLIHFWARDLASLYWGGVSYYMMRYQLGYDFWKLIYDYNDIVIDLVEDGHTLKLQGSSGLNPQIQRMIKPIYKNKMNRKFAKYIPENHVGYMSLNFNIEAYLQAFPLMAEMLYGNSLYLADYGEIAGIVSTALEIVMDEKAIAKVMGGDHIVFVNELKKVKKEYIDYEYDDDYNYKEITKTKDDYIPTFLWMFTSEDQRIYHKILQLGEAKNKVTQNDGVFEVSDGPNGDPLYLLFKDNIAFVSNDEEQIRAIATNQFRASRDSQIKKQLFSHNLTAVTHLSEVPETINRLGIPVIKTWDRTVNNLSHYGDITITAQGLKKGRIMGEISIDFPKQETNALQYLLQELLNIRD